MSRKMTRELKEIDRVIDKCVNDPWWKPATQILLHYTQRRVNITDKIGRRTVVKN